MSIFIPACGLMEAARQAGLSSSKFTSSLTFNNSTLRNNGLYIIHKSLIKDRASTVINLCFGLSSNNCQIIKKYFNMIKIVPAKKSSDSFKMFFINKEY